MKGDLSLDTIKSREKVGISLLYFARFEESEVVLKDTLNKKMLILDKTHEEIGITERELGTLFCFLKKYEDSKNLLERAMEKLKKKFTENSREYACALKYYGHNLGFLK